MAIGDQLADAVKRAEKLTADIQGERLRPAVVELEATVDDAIFYLNEIAKAARLGYSPLELADNAQHYAKDLRARLERAHRLGCRP